MAGTFLDAQKRRVRASDENAEAKLPAGCSEEDLAELVNNSEGSFYERYKRLLKCLGMARPEFLHELSTLEKLRNALVHFRTCEVQIVLVERTIRDHQPFPPELGGLRPLRYERIPVLAPLDGYPWTHQVSTNAMVAWAVNLSLDAMSYVLQQIPAGAFCAYVQREFASADPQFPDLVARRKWELEDWWAALPEKRAK